MNPFSGLVAPQDAAQQKRPAKLISGNRRQLHAHLRDQGQSANSAHSQNDRGHGGANGITRQSASAAAIAQPRHAGGPPGMPWMNAHAPPSTHRPPSPPPLPEDPGAYCDTSSVSGGLSRPRRYHANAYLSGARQSSPHTSDHGTHNHGTCVNSGIAFADEQAKLQDEMMKMQMQNDLKRQSMAAKMEEARLRKAEAAAKRAEVREREEQQRKTEQLRRIRDMEEQIRLAQREAREDEERQAEETRQREARRRQAAAAPTKPESRQDAKQAQENEFKRRQAAADARRAREAAANGARARIPPAKPPGQGQSKGGVGVFRSHERSWSQFENTPPKTITVRAIPWPPADEDLLRGSVALAMTEQKCTEDEAIRAQYKRLAMRWHPDKFLARFGGCLQESERDAILERVKATQQAINQTYNLLK
mmetsp:Transcript_14609/g.37502  ORF Transcript_14609/g.37502 Transcript_14609/m.37502 type:complete len:421 (+) Transcript_14609:239-1501(+)|eukprot:jgi/Tetstr1/429436/TSEL_019346.t1